VGRLFALLVLVPGVFLSLPSCGRGEAEPAGVVRLKVWSMWTGQEEKNFERVLRRYEELHPTIRIENLGAVRDDTQTVRAIVAGVPPDLFTLADPLFLGPLAANGALHSMDAWFTESGLREPDFVPASLRQCRYESRLYAMPFLIDDYALFWNKKAFRAAGLDPERPPRTMEELEAFAVKLTRQEDGHITQLGLQPLDDIYPVVAAFGGRLFDPETRQVTPDDPNNVTAFTWYARVIERMGGYQAVNSYKAGFGQAQGSNNPFFVGKVAMMMNGEWNPYWIHRYAPGLEYGVAPIPPPADRPSLARPTWLGGNMFCIPKGSPHAKEAWELLVWMQTDEAQILLAAANNNVPNQRSSLQSPALRDGADYKVKFRTFLDLADSPNAGNFPALPVANLYNAEMVTARDLVLNGEKKPERALRDVRVRVQRELDKYRGGEGESGRRGERTP
jgi:multiple sugar transport system substrate-binding protein